MVTTDTFTQRSISFGRALRRAGVHTTMGQVKDFIPSAEVI
jgi:hypothetical protein